jgi:hypothetical protein
MMGSTRAGYQVEPRSPPATPRQALEAVGVEQRLVELPPLLVVHIYERRVADELPDAVLISALAIGRACRILRDSHGWPVGVGSAPIGRKDSHVPIGFAPKEVPMLAKVRSRLSYANVVSTACLFIVLGGTSYAVATGSIDSREIKNNTVRSKDIRNNDVRSKDVRNSSLLSKDFKPGQLPAGPRGLQGPQGERGPQGLPGQNATRLFAYIRDTTPGDAGTASVQYGSGVTGATDGSSTYLVTFNRSVVNCVVQATPGLGNPQGTSPIHVGDANVEVRVAIPATNNAAIGFTNNAGAQVDTSFLVTAFC